MRLSEAIRLGSMTVKETKCWPIYDDDGNCLACALGTAWFAVTNGKWNKHEWGSLSEVPLSIRSAFSDYPHEVLLRFSKLHFEGTNRLKIADLAEAWEKVNLPTEEKKEEIVEIETEMVMVSRDKKGF